MQLLFMLGLIITLLSGEQTRFPLNNYHQISVVKRILATAVEGQPVTNP